MYTLIDETNDLGDFEEGCAEWRKAHDAGKTGVFRIHVSEIIDFVEQTRRPPPLSFPDRAVSHRDISPRRSSSNAPRFASSRPPLKLMLCQADDSAILYSDLALHATCVRIDAK